MEATRQFVPEEVMERMAEALTWLGITIEEAIQKIRNAIQGITELSESIKDTLEKLKQNKKPFMERAKARIRKIFIKIKLYGWQKIKAIRRKHKPP